MFKGFVVSTGILLLSGVLSGCANTSKVIPSSDGEIASRQRIPAPIPDTVAGITSISQDVPSMKDAAPVPDSRRGSRTLLSGLGDKIFSNTGRAPANSLFHKKAPVVVVEDDPTAHDKYKLDTADRVRVSVFEQRNLSRVYTIDVGGSIDMPLIGAVRARGLTTRALSRVIERRLGARYIKNPKVSIEIQTYRPFFILGEVRNSGQFPFVNNMTVRTAIAIAGGYTERANRRKILLTRRLGGKLFTTYVNGMAKVLPGDTLEVRERLF